MPTLNRHPSRLPPGLRRAWVFVFLLGIVLRVALALVNEEANDDHISVAKVIAVENRLPGQSELWEGFQPKLYHATTAVAWELSPWSSDESLVRIAQLLSCAAGILTLVLVRRFLERWSLPPAIALLAFAFVALNPKLIGLSAQATNDSFVILFVTLALMAAWSFLEQGGLASFAVMLVATVAALATKGNAVVAFGAISMTLAVAVARSAGPDSLSRRRLGACLATFTIGLVVLFSLVGQYRANYDETGDLFSINVARDPLPAIVSRSYLHRPGTISVVDTYLTFRLLDLVRHPYITNGGPAVPFHRTSLWSQLFGRTASVHFDRHPPSWADSGRLVVNLDRGILILALLPALILVLGMVLCAGGALGGLRRATSGRATGDLLLTVTGLGYVAFIVVSTLRYRDFATMKAEYMFPGLAAFVFMFARGASRISHLLERSRPALWRVALGAMVLLIGLQVLDVAVLIARLV